MKTKDNQKFIFKNKYAMPSGRQGFTLLELMVIISIIGIMTSAGLVSLSSSKKHFALKTAQNEVAAAIKLAQSYALQGKFKESVTNVCGIGFRFMNDSTYRIFYYRTGDGYPSCASTDSSTITGLGMIEDQVLGNGVKLTSPTSPDTSTRILFSIPDAKVSGAGISNSPFKLSIGTGSSEKSKTITISSTGLVEED